MKLTQLVEAVNLSHFTVPDMSQIKDLRLPETSKIEKIHILVGWGKGGRGANVLARYAFRRAHAVKFAANHERNLPRGHGGSHA
jgi:hypothetical protein